MSSASDIFTVNVTVSSASPTRAGFGEPLIAAYHTHYTDRVREYSSTQAMVADGFTVNDPAYLAASKIFAQSPAVPALKVGRCALPVQQVINLTLLSTSSTDVYTYSVGVPGATLNSFATNSTGVPATDAATVASAITAASIPNLTVSHSGAVVTLTGAATHGIAVDVITDTVHMSYADVSTDPGIQTDLNAILAADPNWYGLILASNSPAEILQAAAWCDANGKLGGFNATDTAIMNSGSTTDVAYLMKTAGYSWSYGLMSKRQCLSYNAAGWMGRLFPTDAGSENWSFKTLNSVTADTYLLTEEHAVEGKNWNVYSNVLGLNLTRFGVTPGGYGWIDLRRGVDWITNEFQVEILGAFANNLKIPYTDAGRDVLVAVVMGVLDEGVDRNFLAATPAPSVQAPSVSTVSATQRAARNYPVLAASANLAGAINKVTFNLSLSS